MTKIADFITELNRTKPTVNHAYFDAKWNGVVIGARLLINYKAVVRLDIYPKEIKETDPKALAIEVALMMEQQYRERLSMPLLEGKC